MKDYLFSEMLNICREYDDCLGCPFETICQNGIASVNERDIEPRDVIELPCMITLGVPAFMEFVVIYRDKYELIKIKTFDCTQECEANAFLESLKKS